MARLVNLKTALPDTTVQTEYSVEEATLHVDILLKIHDGILWRIWCKFCWVRGSFVTKRYFRKCVTHREFFQHTLIAETGVDAIVDASRTLSLQTFIRSWPNRRAICTPQSLDWMDVSQEIGFIKPLILGRASSTLLALVLGWTERRLAFSILRWTSSKGTSHWIDADNRPGWVFTIFQGQLRKGRGDSLLRLASLFLLVRFTGCILSGLQRIFMRDLPRARGNVTFSRFATSHPWWYTVHVSERAIRTRSTGRSFNGLISTSCGTFHP